MNSFQCFGGALLLANLIEIELKNLLIDTENIRLNEQDSQQSAIEAMIDNQDFKLVTLARDILLNGLNPFMYIAVIPHNKKEGKHIVVDGNRRVIALKLLQNPELAKNNDVIHNQFKVLHEEFLTNPISRLICSVFKTREEVIPWLERIHVGGLKGASTENWPAVAKQRFNVKYKNKTSQSLQVLNFVLVNNCINSDIQNNINTPGKFPISTLDRVLKDKYVKNSLGLSYDEKGFYSTKYSHKNLGIILGKIVTDLGRSNNPIKVGSLINKELRKEYIEKITEGIGIDALEQSLFHSEPEVTEHAHIQLPSSDSEGNHYNQAHKKDITNQTKPNKPEDLTLTNNEKQLDENNKKQKPEIFAPLSPKIPKVNIFFEGLETSIPIDDSAAHGLLSIAREIREINYNRFPNAAAMLLRTLLEQSLKYHYLKMKNKPIKNKNNNDPLLGEILKIYNDQLNYLISDSTQRRNFNSLFPDPIGKTGLKTTLDLIIHHTNITQASPDLLKSIAKSGLYSFIEYILTYDYINQ